MQWDYRGLGPFDFVWASPPCTQYSRARTTGGARDLEGTDALVAKTLEIIDYFKPRFFLLENPPTGLLKTRAVMARRTALPRPVLLQVRLPLPQVHQTLGQPPLRLPPPAYQGRALS